MTKSQLLLSAAVAGLMSASIAVAANATGTPAPASPAAAPATSAPGIAPAAGTDKCYGIAKAGQNACASATGAHACKGLAKVDNDPGDFVLLAASDCTKAGGKTTAPMKKM